MGSPTGWEIVGAAGLLLAVVSLVAWVVTAVALRRVRRDQSAVLGNGGEQDLVRHAVALDARVRAAVADWHALSTTLSERMAGIEGALLRVFSRHGIVRYDAYGEQSGQQSCSLAMLDVRGDGVIVTSIHHRDEARVYIRRVVRGQPEHRLAPEEDEALRDALHAGTIAFNGTIGDTPAAPREGVDAA